MIAVSEALSLISSSTVNTTTRELPLQNAHGLILCKDVHAAIDMPPFRQSAMDGYALRSDATATTYTVIGEVKAGDAHQYPLAPGQAVRIFTGARVPDQADTVIMQEKVIRTENTITIDGAVATNKNIRPQGEQIKKGEVAVPKGTTITPATIGFIAGLGIDTVAVYTPPKVTIITTGSELVPIGNPLPEGKIYESNSLQLQAALAQLNCQEINIQTVADTYDHTKQIIQQAITDSDVVLISGGISVGDYDFVKRALEALDTQQIFYKIKQKPGKPLYYGINGGTPIFALPGNPASSLTCFYIYAVPLIRRMMGHATPELQHTSKKITSDFVKKGDRAQFLKATATNHEVTPLLGQSSAMLHTFAIANALIYIPADQNNTQKGTKVITITLPQYT